MDYDYIDSNCWIYDIYIFSLRKVRVWKMNTEDKIIRFAREGMESGDDDYRLLCECILEEFGK